MSPRLTIFFLLIIHGFVQAHYIIPEQSIEDFKRLNNLIDPAPERAAQVLKIFKICNIKQPIIVLEDPYKNSHHSSIGRYQSGYYQGSDFYPTFDKIIFVLCTKDNKNSLEFLIYHECAHMLHGDLLEPDSARQKKYFFLLLAWQTISYIALNALNLKNSFYQKCMRSTYAASSLLSPLICVAQYYHRSQKEELAADRFAIAHLLQQDDIMSIVNQFLIFVTVGSHEYTSYQDRIRYHFEHHPPYLQRAEQILNELQKAGINLATLPIHATIYNKAKIQELMNRVRGNKS